MSGPDIACHDDRRRALVRATARANGIDYIEVKGTAAKPELHVTLLRTLPPDDPVTLFTEANITFPGTGLAATGLDFRRAEDPERDDIAVIPLADAGNGTPATLVLTPTVEAPLTDMDPRYRSAPFSFLPETTDLDCDLPAPCPPEPGSTPELDYLAKDYASFRQLLLDRLAVTLPGWRERHSPDLYLTLVEILAYAADHLSYAQDAVATEAYLDTARLRTSVRRHARLVDYPMHEGCNARAWVCLEVEGNPVIAADALSFVTRPTGVSESDTVLLPDALRRLSRASYEVFEPLLEDGPCRIAPRDIVDPDAVAGRLHRGRGGAIDQIRGHLLATLRPLQARDDLGEGTAAAIRALAERRNLDAGQRAALHAPLARDDIDPGQQAALRVLLAGIDPAAIERATLANDLVGLLNIALSDLRLARERHGGLAAATGCYGTPNALTGASLCRHNRQVIAETFPQAVARPGRLVFREDWNEIPLHTWHAVECCLPKGATRATLRDAWLDEGHRRLALEHIREGHLLLLEERLNPRTGNPADVDPTHRHAVRLTSADRDIDPIGEVPVVQVTWDAADALPFPLVLSAIGPAPECALLENVSVARGNVVLVDHGETVREPSPARLRDDIRTWVAVPFDPPHDIVPPEEVGLCCTGEGRVAGEASRPVRHEPVLARSPLVFSEPLPSRPPEGKFTAASALLRQEPCRALPQAALFSPLAIRRPWLDVVERLPDTSMVRACSMPYERWRSRPDLLASDRDDRHFVVEVDDGGMAHLRFGDGEQGARPVPDTRFLAWYRTGGGRAGNVGSETIRHLVLRGEIRGGQVVAIRNPLPAGGGIDREPVAEVRLKAPFAFRGQLQRAIIAADYAAIVMRDFPERVQQAAASVAVAADNTTAVRVWLDLRGGGEPDPELEKRIRDHLERFRRIGHVVRIAAGTRVPIDLELTVGVLPHHQPGTVRMALRDRFGNRALPDGSSGFFHPDVLTFGQGIAISQIVAAAHRIPGVAWVKVPRLRRHGDAKPLPAGDVLEIGEHEIARMDNDPANPAGGGLAINVEVAT